MPNNKVLESKKHERNYVDFDICDVEQIENEFGGGTGKVSPLCVI